MRLSLISGEGVNSMHFYYEMTCSLLENKDGVKIYLGDAKNKVCRYCNKDSKHTSFKKKAHIIPEFMGNKYCFSNFECDSCNAMFGNWEDSLANFAGIYNSFSKLKGKRGYAKFKNPEDEFELFAKNENAIISRISKSFSDNKSIKIDTDNEQMLFNVKQPSYIPQDAFKALMKIAISMLDDQELKVYQKAIKWINDITPIDYGSHPLFKVYRKIGGEKRFLKPWAILYRKRDFADSRIPCHTLFLVYGIIQYQIFLPFHQDENNLIKSDQIILPIDEHIVNFELDKNKKMKPSIDIISLGSISKVNREKKEFSFGFKKNKF